MKVLAELLLLCVLVYGTIDVVKSEPIKQHLDDLETFLQSAIHYAFTAPVHAMSFFSKMFDLLDDCQLLTDMREPLFSIVDILERRTGLGFSRIKEPYDLQIQKCFKAVEDARSEGDSLPKCVKCVRGVCTRGPCRDVSVVSD